MAGIGTKVINKLARRSKSVKEAQRGKYDRENRLEYQLRKSPRAFQLVRKEQRRQDANFGNDVLSQKPVLAFAAEALSVARVVYMSGHAIQLTLTSQVEAGMGLQPGDVVEFLNGTWKGYQLLVVSIVDSTHINLQDIATYGAEEFNVNFRAFLSSEKSSYY